MRNLLPLLAFPALLSACSAFAPGAPVPEDPALMERADGQAAPDPGAVGAVLANMTRGSGGSKAKALARGAAAGTAELREPGEPRVGPGVLLPYGAVGKACDVGRKEMGALIEKSGKWKLFDARPGATSVRNFFVTGFKDGCARQVSGAVALFGDLELYELMHFGGGGGAGVSETDAAYARLRGGTCRGKGPCSESGVRKLARSTAFVSIYPAAGASRSLELLMHDRKLVATALK